MLQTFKSALIIFLLLTILTGIVFYCAAETDPEFNKQFEISQFPSAEFRTEFLKLLAIDVVGTWVVEFVADLLFGSK